MTTHKVNTIQAPIGSRLTGNGGPTREAGGAIPTRPQ